MAKTVNKPVSSIVEKWGNRLKGAGPEIAAGVDLVIEAPGKQAAAQQAKMLANVQQAVSSGKWGRRVAAVSKEEWQTAMKDKGIPRIAAGVDGASGKMANSMTQIVDHINAGLLKISGIKSVTLEDSINRMVTFIRHMSTLEVKR